MKLTTDRDTLLKPLQAVQGVVERRQTLPILSNFLFVTKNDRLSITATDMEIELNVSVPMEGAQEGEITLPARKLVDICRSLPAEAKVELVVDGDRAILRSGRSRFTLSTLPASEYPSFESSEKDLIVDLAQAGLKQVIDLTQFAMAHQDVRYYLNGLLFEFKTGRLRAVATDGHRLAVADLKADIEGEDEPRTIIVPRKAVTELARLLGSDELVELSVGPNQVQLQIGDVRLTSKLVDGKFPDYERVIPRLETCDKELNVDRDALRQCLTRASILSNDKYRAVRLSLEENLLRLTANNPDQEEAEEELELEYTGEPMEIGFNVSYLIDALSALPTSSAKLYMTDPSSSCLITPDEEVTCQYVVMPMRL